MEQIQPYVIGWLVPTVLAAIAGYLGGKLKHLKAIREDMESDRRTLDQLTLLVCRLAIYDEHFSEDEKVDAYRVYRDHGGNSKTKKYMDELLGEDADSYLEHHK